MAAIFASQAPPPLVKTMLGTRRPSDLLGKCVHHLRHVAQREFLVLRRRQHAAPGIEQHDGLRAGGDLRVQIKNRCLCQQFEQSVQICRGASYIMRLIWPKVLLPPPSTMYVATVHGLPAKPMSGTRPCSSRRTSATASVTYLSSRPGSGTPQLVDIGGHAHRTLELRTLAGLEFQPQIHRVRNRENVRKQDCGIQRIAVDRLQRDFAGDLRIGAHLQEIRRRASRVARYSGR